MKKLIVGLAVLAAACHSAPAPGPQPSRGAPVASGTQTGAPDATSAVRGFLAAAKQQDLQAMSVLFGDDQGPARDIIPRDQLEKREIIMAMCLRHDRFDIVGDAPAPGGGRTMVVNVTYGNLSRSSNFEVQQGPGGRWYVRQFDLESLMDICKRK